MTKITSKSRVLVLGLGIEGISVIRYLQRLGIPPSQLTVYDQKIGSTLNLPEGLLTGASTVFGSPLSDNLLEKADIIIKSPGIPNSLLPSRFHSRLTSATQLFFDAFPGTVIGVTGTKGKSTTSSLIHHLLVNSGKPAVLVGNIGRAALDILPGLKDSELVVFELSSHQLSYLHSSPQVAVVLGIFPEHLDYYANMEEYLDAKSPIVRFQTSRDCAIFDADSPQTQELVKLSPGRRLGVSYRDLPAQGFPTSLLGRFNQKNILMALTACAQFGLAQEGLLALLLTFQPLPHRLEPVGTYRGITFINDSLSTVPQATISAMEALEPKVQTLILGGHDRRVDYTPLVAALRGSHVETLILFPPAGKRIWETVLQHYPEAEQILAVHTVSTMAEAVKLAYARTDAGKVCLLSPGASSFANFVDYKDRGDQFRRYVLEESHAED